MKRFFGCVVLACLVAVSSPAQQSQGLDSPAAFRSEISLGTSLADLNAASEDIGLLEQLAEQVLIIDGVAASITVYSTDPADFYVEVELVGGQWQGLDSVTMHTAYVVLDDPTFANRVADRVPRDPPPELLLRNDRVLVAGRLISLAEAPSGDIVPVIHAYDLRPMR